MSAKKSANKSSQDSADVLVLGAGVAGLAAAADLCAAGRRVILVEARDHVGGRVHTLHDPAWPAPIETGAEFIHGRDPEFWRLLASASIAPYECAQELWVSHGKGLEKLDLWKKLDEVFKKFPQGPKPDLSYQAFVRQARRRLPGKKVLDLARLYVEGFNAADASKISVAGLVSSGKVEEEIDADRLFRIQAGFDALVQVLRSRLDPRLVDLRLRSVVEEVRWGRRRVELVCRSQDTGRRFRVRAPKAIVTLPVGVLKARPGTTGHVRFQPPLAQKATALRRIEMGPVVKIAIRFRRAFWETDRIPALGRGQSLMDLGFVLRPGLAFPTWWSYGPLRTPVLMGWVGGTGAARLAGKKTEDLFRLALDSLSKIFGLRPGELDALVEAYRVHEWQSDPFSRGAYSYPTVGGADAAKQLAQPIDDTLFFAGEATEHEGLSATVPGAIATGHRAAREVLGPR